MHDTVVPVPQPRLQLSLPLLLFDVAAVELAQQERNLLAERMERLPPRAALMLIAVSHKDFVEERVDVMQHCDVMLTRVQEVGSSDDGGCRGHLGAGVMGQSGRCDGHCEIMK